MTIWERIDTFTERLSVPGGWIVKSSYSHTGVAGAVAVACHQVFIADEAHAWPLPEPAEPEVDNRSTH
jgi:hypothetical protein